MTNPQPKQKIGLWTSTSLVVGNMIGAGVFLMPAAMASFGSIGLLGWVFAAIGSFFLAKVFSNLSKLLPNAAGGPYAYTRHALGDFAGFLIAWGYYLANCCAIAAILVSFISAMSTFFPVLAHDPVAAVITGLCTIWLLIFINSRGIKAAGFVQVLTTILKLVPLIAVAITGLFFIHTRNFTPFNTSGMSVFSAITTTAAMAMFSFIGIECATVSAGEVDDVGNTVSKATLLGLGISTLVFILGSVSVMGLIPAGILSRSPTPYADAAGIIFGDSARYWVSAGMAIAAFGALNGWMLMQGQMPSAIANDKLFPRIFARLNKKNVAWFGMVLSGFISSCFICMNYSKGLVDQFKALQLVATLSVLVPYLFCAASYPIIRAQKKAAGGWTGAVAIAVLAFGYSLWAIAGSGQNAVFSGFIMLMLGIPMYVWVTAKGRP